jgi:hypothetical protein
MAPLKGTAHCFKHSARTAAARKRSASKGGKRSRVPNAATPYEVASIESLQTIVGRAVADTLKHPNSLQRSGILARLTMTAKSLFEVGEVQEQLEQLKDMLARRGGER